MNKLIDLLTPEFRLEFDFGLKPNFRYRADKGYLIYSDLVFDNKVNFAQQRSASIMDLPVKISIKNSLFNI